MFVWLLSHIVRELNSNVCSHLPGMGLQPYNKFMQIKKSKPEQGMLEINNDAVMGISHSLLAAVVRNVGECLQAVMKSYSTEPEVYCKGTEAKKNHFCGDLKSVFKLSDSKTFQASWRTSYVTLDIVDLSQVLTSVVFSWVRLLLTNPRMCWVNGSCRIL